MLIGRHEAKLTDKRQVAFPKKFREILGEKLVITKGLDNNLVVVSEKNWEALLEGTQGRPFTNKSTRETQRFLLGNATLIELDAQGRFILPDYLKDYAQIEKDIIFAGIRRYVEMWSRSAWNEQQEKLSENIASITERLSTEDE